MARRMMLVGLLCCLLAEPLLAEPVVASAPPGAPQSFLQTGVQTMKGPLAALDTMRVLMVFFCAIAGVIPPDDFGMPQGCALVTSILYLVNVIVVFMFIATNEWFFAEIINFPLFRPTDEAMPTRQDRQARLNQSSMVALAVSVVYGLAGYACFQSTGLSSCQEKRRSMSLFFLPLLVLTLTGMIHSRLQYYAALEQKPKPPNEPAESPDSMYRGVVHHKYIEPSPSPSPSTGAPPSPSPSPETGTGGGAEKVSTAARYDQMRSINSYFSHNPLSALSGAMIMFLTIHSALVCR